MVAEEVRGKGKRGLLRIIFGRTTFFILFMALQIAVLAWIYFWLDDRYQAYEMCIRDRSTHRQKLQILQ